MANRIYESYLDIMNNFLAGSVRALKDMHKAYVSKHKELFNSLKDLEIRAAQGYNIAKTKDSSTTAHLSKTVSSLIDLDQRSIIYIQKLSEKSKRMEIVQNSFKTVKTQLANTEKYIIKELKAFESIFEETSKLPNLSTPQEISPIKTNEKIKEVLKIMISPDILNKCLKHATFTKPLKLSKNFYLDFAGEEPELELHSENESKKVIHHLAFLIRTIEHVAGELIKIIKDSNNELDKTPVIEKNYFPPCVTPSELKVIKLKINRLHNRGSLTDEEAFDMLGRISVIPASPDNQNSGFGSDDQYNFNDFDKRLDPGFAHKHKNVFEESFCKDLGKRTTTVKRLSKRCSTPAKKIIRNTSLPKAIFCNKISSKEKTKKTKFKSKSPNSFM